LFNNDLLLVGGAGTSYSETQSNSSSYALVDGLNGNPGYFTALAMVSFDSNGGTGSMPKQKLVNGSITPSSTFTAPDNSIFLSWNTSQTGEGGTPYNVGSTLPLGNDLKLYAQWLPANNSITFIHTINAGEGAAIDGITYTVSLTGKTLTEEDRAAGYKDVPANIAPTVTFQTSGGSTTWTEAAWTKTAASTSSLTDLFGAATSFPSAG
jgi:hypothetical protein